MKQSNQTYQVAIVGGGPVGLYLGCLLHQAGISCTILEKRAAPVTHSRSIGIHPVSLELFKQIGLAEKFIAQGIRVKRGHAYWNSQHIGTLNFTNCPPPYPFILTLPQYKTEQILNDYLQQINGDILQRNAKVTALHQTKNGVKISVDIDGQSRTIQTNYLIGCDGKNSFVRREAGINFQGSSYNDTYIMGDFSDNTGLKTDAAIYLCDDGLIESFPLSESVRRWVVKTDDYLPNIDRTDIEKRIKTRIDHDLTDTENRMLSSFGVEKKMAETMCKGRIVLAGDAAHVISPIGGQGMNLGWLDAADLADAFERLLEYEEHSDKLLQQYSNQRLKVARKAARRAEFNMALGRNNSRLPLKKYFVQGLIKSPLSQILAHLFTMRGLSSYPV